MKQFIRIGVDLAKNCFQIHALTSEAAMTRKVTRLKLREFFWGSTPAASAWRRAARAHYWARELKAMGHEVQLMAPAYTKPYVK